MYQKISTIQRSNRMSETRTYLSVKIVAELYHYCERRINQMIDEGKIEGRPLFGQGKGRGGKVNEVLLEILFDFSF